VIPGHFARQRSQGRSGLDGHEHRRELPERLRDHAGVDGAAELGGLSAFLLAHRADHLRRDRIDQLGEG